MTWEINLEEGECHLVLLALARLGLDRPGWRVALGELVSKFPEGSARVYESFRESNSDEGLNEKLSAVAETSAKIIETVSGLCPNCAEKVAVVVEEVRRFSSDLERTVEP